MAFRIYRERRHKPRSCDICHGTYRWCNKYKGWIRQGKNSKQKSILTICLKCQPETQANKAMIMAEVNIIKHNPQASRLRRIS